MAGHPVPIDSEHTRGCLSLLSLGSKQEQEISKDDGTYHWNTFVVPFIKGEVLPDFLCGMSEEYISTYRKSMEDNGLEHWKESFFPLLRQSCVEQGWYFGVSEEAMAEVLRPRRLTCSRIWKYNDDEQELCVACVRPLGNHNHEEVCRDQPHDHGNLCCACHARYHDFQDPCGLCGEKFYEDSGMEVRLGCGHLFHPNCIKAHLRKKNICPICKVKAVCPGGHYGVPFV